MYLQDDIGNTALIISAEHESVDILELLIDSGADHTIKNNHNKMVTDYNVHQLRNSKMIYER